MLKYIIVAIIIVCLYCLFVKRGPTSSAVNANASEGTLQGEQKEPMSSPLSKEETPEANKTKFVMLQNISSKTPSFLNWAVAENSENPNGAKTHSLTYSLEPPKSNNAQNMFIFDEDATISENRIVLRCPSEIKTHFILEAKESHYLLKTDFNGSGHTHYFLMEWHQRQ